MGGGGNASPRILCHQLLTIVKTHQNQQNSTSDLQKKCREQSRQTPVILLRLRTKSFSSGTVEATSRSDTAVKQRREYVKAVGTVQEWMRNERENQGERESVCVCVCVCVSVCACDGERAPRDAMTHVTNSLVFNAAAPAASAAAAADKRSCREPLSGHGWPGEVQRERGVKGSGAPPLPATITVTC